MNSRQFRNALGQFPTGVVVATARTEAGQLVGMTMSSFNSVSLDPPLVLFSVLRQARGFPVWQTIERYAINVLNEEQEQVSNQFARADRGQVVWYFSINGRYRGPDASECCGSFRMSGSRAV